MRPLLASLTFLISAAFPTLAVSSDRVLVAPLDTAAVSLDGAVPTSALQDDEEARRTSPAALIAREFHPRFGAAIALAARGIVVIDLSTPGAAARTEDTARYSLRVHALTVSQTTRTVARRTIPPEPPGFDPATGQMTPGTRRARTEGPGQMSTLTATASWVLWDNAGDSAFVHATSAGASTYRGEAARHNWDEAARELAKALLHKTPFSPPR
jgi:hypothetical protein